jgi:streptomycin 3"-adenylyltransferase
MQPPPSEPGPTLERITATIRSLQASQLVGIYLHGSLAMGCYHPRRSDIDFLVVTDGPLQLGRKREMARAMLEIDAAAPGGGLEMSVVTRAAAERPAYPTPFELHFSRDWADAYRDGQLDLASSRTDADLPGHFVITRERGRVLWGEPIERVFGPVPAEHYTASIVRDAQQCVADLLGGAASGRCRVPTYGVLNLCRVAAWLEDGRVTSKAEGARWGLKHVGSEHHALIDAALAAYAGAMPWPTVDAASLVRYARSMQSRLGA